MIVACSICCHSGTAQNNQNDDTGLHDADVDLFNVSSMSALDVL
jgi:hypothetical protein